MKRCKKTAGIFIKQNLRISLKQMCNSGGLCDAVLRSVSERIGVKWYYKQDERKIQKGLFRAGCMDHFISTVTNQEIRREKQKARDLRKTQWWKRKCASGTCYYCGRKIPPKDLTMDHIVPIIRGGKSARNNVVTSCKECNNKKKHSLPVEWEEYLERLHNEEID